MDLFKQAQPPQGITQEWRLKLNNVPRAALLVWDGHNHVHQAKGRTMSVQVSMQASACVERAHVCEPRPARMHERVPAQPVRT